MVNALLTALDRLRYKNNVIPLHNRYQNFCTDRSLAPVAGYYFDYFEPN